MFGFLGLDIRKKIHAPLNRPVQYNSKENTDKFYADEKLVANYENAFRISFYREIIQTLSSIKDFKNIETIADVSAGTGGLLKEFRIKFPDKTFSGFENSDTALALCRKNCPSVPFGKIDLYERTDKKFDLVLCVDTLEHLEHPETALSNMLNMVSAGGFLFLVVPNGRYDTFEGHIHYWSPESFKLFLKKSGCVIEYTKVYNKYNEQCAAVRK